MMPVPEGIKAALTAWGSALPEGAVLSTDEILTRYARSTAPRATRPCAVLYPESTEHVSALLRIASAHRVPVYPISRGKNWGYGDACAPTDGAAIADLSRMNRILEVNGELGCALIEPGVTQQQLYERVQQEAPGFWMDCSGAGCGASVLGNAIDRGFGHTPYGDHVRSTCGMEIVLADGRVLHTGFGHFDAAKAAHVYPYGVGPILDGLFMQSNLGIVTRLGVWLYPAPEAFRFFYIGVAREDGLQALIDALRPLRLRGILNSAVHIGNDLRIISSLRRYPWRQTGGKTPLPEPVREQLRREFGVSAWNVSGSLTGTRSQVRGAAKALRRAVAGHGKLVFVTDTKLSLGRTAVAFLNRFGLGRVMARQLEGLTPNYGLLKGIPTDAPLLGTQWRLRHPPETGTADPLDTGCGLLWISPVLPLRGADATALLERVEPLFRDYGFELLVTFTMLNERAMVAILNMAFDKADPRETVSAQACYDAVMGSLMKSGYIPYRVNVGGMHKLHTPGDTFWQTAQNLKHALDPGAIIAPGRYIPPL